MGIKGIMKSDVAKEQGEEFLENAIGLLSHDPITIVSSLAELRKFSLTIRDTIFLENFEN